ncbi:hypothetical protein V8D89_001190 [Ganoderma adspersum]
MGGPPANSVLVDVGGGIGSQSIFVAQVHLHIHVVVEDREQVVSTAGSMMDTFDAKERTVDEMTALMLSTGWEIVETRQAPSSMWAYTTAVPV